MFIGSVYDRDKVEADTVEAEHSIFQTINDLQNADINPVALMLAIGRCAESVRAAAMVEVYKTIVVEEMAKDENGRGSRHG